MSRNKTKNQFKLTQIFGDTVRIKVMEILLENYLKDQIAWLNISKIAKKAEISTSSSKRIVDQLIKETIIHLNPIETHAKNPEKEIRLNIDNKVVQELLFFYRKLKGLI